MKPEALAVRPVSSSLLLLALAFAAASCAATPEPKSSAAAPPAAASATVAPSAPPETADAVVAGARARFDLCYDAARAKNPGLGRTTLELNFTVGPSGKPLAVDIQYRNRFEDLAKECIRDAAEALVFPPSLAGKQRVTLTFAPGK